MADREPRTTISLTMTLRQLLTLQTAMRKIADTDAGAYEDFLLNSVAPERLMQGIAELRMEAIGRTFVDDYSEERRIFRIDETETRYPLGFIERIPGGDAMTANKYELFIVDEIGVRNLVGTYSYPQVMIEAVQRMEPDGACMECGGLRKIAAEPVPTRAVVHHNRGCSWWEDPRR